MLTLQCSVQLYLAFGQFRHMSPRNPGARAILFWSETKYGNQPTQIVIQNVTSVL